LLLAAPSLAAQARVAFRNPKSILKRSTTTMNLNRVTIIGYVGQEPVIKENSRTQAALSVATTKRWKDGSDQLQEKTSWHRVFAFGAAALYAQKSIAAGDFVFVEGELNYGEYDRRIEDVDGHSYQVRWPSIAVVADLLSVIQSKTQRGKTDDEPEALEAAL
jgi:single stranded DNA-binding protein